MDNKSKIYSGSKFYRYAKGSNIPEVIRVRNIEYDKKIARIFDSNGNKKKIQLSSLLSSYRMIAPDGMINISEVMMIGGVPDVIVALKNMNDTRDNDEHYNKDFPYVACRQMVTDVFSSMADPNKETLGLCMSQDTCPAGIDYRVMFSCQNLVSTKMICVYVDDTFDSIMEFINPNKYDRVFNILNDRYKKNGICKNLKELLETNNFMYDFRRCFNIIEVPFDIGDNDEGLSDINIASLEKELNIKILETYVIKYSKQIDTTKFKRDFVLVSPASSKYNKLFIVGYDAED